MARTSSKRRFEYKEPDQKKLKERAEQTGGRFDSPYKENADLFLPKEGNHTIRILEPTWDNHEHYGYDIWVHNYVGADNSNYLCPRKMQDKRCPICEAANAAKEAGEDDDAKKLAVQRRVLVWVIDRNTDDEPPIPKLWSMSWSQDRDIVEVSKNKKTGKVLLIDHPDDGYDITFRRTGKGLNTKYFGWQVDRESSPICEDEKEQENIRDFIMENPVPSMLKFYSYDYLQKMISGGAEKKDELDDDAEDESENEGREAQQSTRTKSKKRDEDEDTADDDEPPRKKSRSRDEDEDDDPPPRKKSKPRDEDEDADDEPPARQRSKSKSKDEDEEEIEERRPSRRRDEDEDDDPPPRKKAAKKDEDEDEPPFDEDEDVGADEPSSKRSSRKQADDEDDEPTPRRRAKR